MESPYICEEIKTKLKEQIDSLDPFEVADKMKNMIKPILKIALR
jgi:hypothetical protein